jgi:cobalt-zinc-cadmium efflux system membrane fusion protein
MGVKNNRAYCSILPALVVLNLAGTLLCGCISVDGSVKNSAGTTPTEQTDASQSDTTDQDKHLVHVSRNAENLAGVTTEQAIERKLDVCVSVTGEVLANANTQAHVTTPVTGRVMQILVRIGDHICQDKPLMIVRSTDIEQAESDMLQNAQQVRSDLKQAMVQIDCDTATSGAQVKLSEKVFERLKNLVDEKIASQADFQSAQTQFVKDQIAVDSLKHKREATISLSQEKMKLVTEPAKTKLRMLGVSDEEINQVIKTQVVDPLVPVLSPEDGIIVERLVNVGELIDPSKPLFTIGDFHSVWLKADVFEKDIPKVAIGEAIQLQVDSFPDRVFDGKLDYVANQIDPDTRTLVVRAEVDNPQALLKPKMFGRMKILVGQHKVLAVPMTAVQDARTEKVVYVPAGPDTFEERKIVLGAESGDFVEVLSGLRPGEKVVTKGSFDLRAQSVRLYG